MQDKTQLFNDFFRAEDRFHADTDPGFEPDVVVGFIQAGLQVASYYHCRGNNNNILMMELFLKRLFNGLLNAVGDCDKSYVFRRMCLEYIHSPLIELKRLYEQCPNGWSRYLALQQQLHQAHFELKY